jgi:hypothetical protein
MFLVDLAGSERITVNDEVDKEAQRETIGINKSLMVLRKVINELGKKKDKEIIFDDQNNNQPHQSKKYISYRECKLT